MTAIGRTVQRESCRISGQVQKTAFSDDRRHHPFLPDDELSDLLERASYPMLLKFNRLAWRSGLAGPLLPAEFANFLESQER
jgi:hypothetical protein